MPAIELEHFLPYRLARIATAVSEGLGASYNRRHRLTVPEWRTLATIARFEDATASRVATHAMLNKTNVSRAVASLEERGWIQRRIDSDDRRFERLRLTPLGQRAFGEIVPAMIDYEARLLARLDDAADMLGDVLEALEAALDLDAGTGPDRGR